MLGVPVASLGFAPSDTTILGDALAEFDTDDSALLTSAETAYGPVTTWDVTSVGSNLQSLLDSLATFDQDMSGWDVSSATMAVSMFSDAVSFNQPLTSWDCSSLRDTSAMFWTTTAFNQPLAWDTAALTATMGML